MSCLDARTQYFLDYPDALSTGYDAWTHYQKFGKAQGRLWKGLNCDGVNVGTWTGSTQAYETFTFTDTGFTSVSIAWTNNTLATYDFKVSIYLGTTPTVALNKTTEYLALVAGGTKSHVFVGLTPATNYIVKLSRKELGAYVEQYQSSYTRTTNAITSVVVYGSGTQMVCSVSSNLPTSVDPGYQIRINTGTLAPTVSTQFIAALSVNIPATAIAATDVGCCSTWTYTLQGLTAKTQYYFNVFVNSSDSTYASGVTGLTGVARVVGRSFEMVDVGQLTAANTRCSYVDLLWGGDTDFTYFVKNKATGSVQCSQVGPSVTTAPARFLGLSPGTNYTLTLFRYITSSLSVEEGSLAITTPSSSLQIVGVSTTSVQLSWASAYTGASYIIEYRVVPVTGTPGTPTKTTATTALMTTLTRLTPNTVYEIVLTVVENGANIILGTASTAPLGIATANAPLGIASLGNGTPFYDMTSVRVTVAIAVIATAAVLIARYAARKRHPLRL